MEPLSILCILIGLMIIALRAPMIFAPEATLHFFDRLISTDSRLRGVGLMVAPLGWALIHFAHAGEGWAAGILSALGWVLAVAAISLLATPGAYRRLATGVLAYFESSVDMAVVRIIGVVAVAIGLALIYAGVHGV